MKRARRHLTKLAASGWLALTPTLLLTAGSPAAPTHPLAAFGPGHSPTLPVGAQLSDPDQPRQGRRVFSGPSTDTADSANWSGYAGTTTAVRGAEGTWTVPAVTTSKTRRYSSSWIGVDGLNNSWLIQTGTAQDSSSGGTSYHPWLEVLTPSDAAPERVIDAAVAPGDAMSARLQRMSAGSWQIYLADATKGWYFQQDFTFNGPGVSAEWIEEAPTVDGHQSRPADWRTAHFARTAVYDGSDWRSTDMTSHNAIRMVTSRTVVLAVPGPISAAGPSGQSFADVWGPPTAPPVGPPSRPIAVSSTAEKHSIVVRWGPPARTGGRPIADYVIREYRDGVLHQRFLSTSHTFKVRGLTHEGRYSFAVAASNRSYTSVFSARTAPLHALR